MAHDVPDARNADTQRSRVCDDDLAIFAADGPRPLPPVGATPATVRRGEVALSLSYETDTRPLGQTAA